jgi:hypothetical protein
MDLDLPTPVLDPSFQENTSTTVQHTHPQKYIASKKISSENSQITHFNDATICKKNIQRLKLPYSFVKRITPAKDKILQTSVKNCFISATAIPGCTLLLPNTARTTAQGLYLYTYIKVDTKSKKLETR